MKRAYPETELKECDVLKVDGYLNLSCYLDDGGLKVGLVPAEVDVSCPYEPWFAGYVPSQERFVVESYGNVYLVGNNDFYKSQQTLNAKRPFLVTYPAATPVTYFIGDNKCVIFEKNKISSEAYNYGICAGVFKNGRIFAADADDGYKIRWSGPDGYKDWGAGLHGAGWTRINGDKGEIQRLAVYKNDVVAICDYGIVVLSAFGAPENFKLSYIDGDLQKIYDKTAVTVLDKLVFFAGEKLYVFDGNKISEAEYDLKGEIENPASAAALGEWYCICGYAKRLERNAALCVNILSGKAYFADIGGATVCSHDKVYFILKNKMYALEEGEYTFESGSLDFGTHKRKVLERLEIKADGNVDVEVTNGVKSRIFKGVRGNLRVKMSGNAFKITVRGTERVKSIKAFAEVLSGL